MQQFLFLQIIHYNKEKYEQMREIIVVYMKMKKPNYPFFKANCSTGSDLFAQ